MKYKVNETIITASNSAKALKAYKIFRDSKFRDSKASDIVKDLKSKFPGVQLETKTFSDEDGKYTSIKITGYFNDNKHFESEFDAKKYLAKYANGKDILFINGGTLLLADYTKDSIRDIDLDKYQEWVDYDMKHYGHISDKTNRLVKEAGLEIVKDIHGDYEVIAHEDNGYRKDSKFKDEERLVSYKDYVQELRKINLNSDLVRIEELDFYFNHEPIKLGLNWSAIGTADIRQSEEFIKVLQKGLNSIKNFKYNGYKIDSSDHK